MSKAAAPEIDALTAAEIGRLAAECGREREEKVKQRQLLFQQRQAGVAPSAIPADEVAARQFALEKLNGSAPAYMRELQTDDPDHQLATQICGLDMVLRWPSGVVTGLAALAQRGSLEPRRVPVVT